MTGLGAARQLDRRRPTTSPVLPDWFSDGFAAVHLRGLRDAQTLYADAEETILEASRPVIVNSIARRPQPGRPMHRCVFMNPAGDPGPSRRRRGKEFWEAFRLRQAQASRLPADTLAGTSARLPNVHLDRNRGSPTPRSSETGCLAIGENLGRSRRLDQFYRSACQRCRPRGIRHRGAVIG